MQLAEGARHRAIATSRLVLHIVVEITGDKEIEPSIPVIIAPRRAIGPVSESHSSLLGDIGKCSVMIIAVQPVLTEVGNEDIRPAVIIEVRDSHAKAPT